MMQDFIHDDLRTFHESESLNPPTALSQKLLHQVHQQLSFSRVSVVGKLAFVHAFTTLFVLYICPQFGVSWGNASLSLTDAFLQFGHEVCAALCGVVLVGGTFFFTSLVLRPEEGFWLKKQMPWIPVSFSVLTLIWLASMGARAHHTEYVVWCVFGILGGWIAFEVGRKGRVLSLRLLARTAV